MRKKLLAIVLCCGFAGTASAQINSGTVIAGGSLGVSTYTEAYGNNERTIRSLDFYPSIGFFIRDNLAVGLNTGWNNSRDKNAGAQQENSGFRVGIFTRKYRSLSKGFYLFGEAGAGYDRQKQDNTSANQNSYQTRNTFRVYVYPGVSYAVGRRLQLEAALADLLQISYNRTHTAYSTPLAEGGNRASNFGLQSGIGNNIPLNLGFRLFLGK